MLYCNNNLCYCFNGEFMTDYKNGLLVFKCKTKKQDPKLGEGIITFPENYTVIDLETTGLDPKSELIIEFAAVKVRDNKVVDTFQQLCDPGYPIPSMVEALTGITTEMVRSCPNPRSVLPDFLNFTGDDFVVGHNVLFDVRFIAQSADIFKNDYIDTMKIFRKLHPDLPHHRLSDMVSFYGKRNQSAHRALSDCLATNDCFNAIAEEALKLFGSCEGFLKTLK